MTTTEFTLRQYDQTYPPGIEQHFWNSARNAIIAARLSRAEMANGSLLEIGCGTGIVLDYLRRRGMDCIGCDLASAPVPDRLRDVVLTGTDFRSLAAETRHKIDGVLLCDVIEHLPDPGSFLSDIRAALPKLRRILVTVPARQELWSVWDEHCGHYRRYDPASLEADLKAGGFEPLSIAYFFHSLYAVMYLLRGRRSDTVMAPRWVLPHRLMSLALRAEYALLPSSLPGTSLIAVASV
ncbi:MAG: class I SAM-dependent methyltransferase [Alphaproteobacteria bacterium]|nr:class I SAM-dependent methyltransferase [Alphaproteobacteria bacterium]MBV9586520.1 class I SAM-dependent methyltransferase [Alphaproteobacteria bacterium]MBV9968335.1 class I SAM-dependent methyltransferase [Alphaproteobacteria bacterium]